MTGKFCIFTCKSDKSDMELKADNLGPDTARSLFAELVTQLQATSLWFLRKDIPIDITAPSAPVILNYLAQNCNRSQWVQVQRLKKWRLQNIK
jgi:hypothetical protein